MSENKTFEIAVVVGTRPEIIRLSAVLNKLESAKSFNLTLIHTGQNYDYELNEVFFKELKIKKPDYFLESADSSPLKTVGNIFSKIDDVLNEVKPDAMLVLGDTNSCLSIYAAKRKKIPTFHYEAGNRCFDQRVPEEINRKLIDHISDINLTYSHISREYLVREGLHPDRIIKVGSPMFEVLTQNKEEINSSKVLSELKIEKDSYILVSAHREENVNDSDRLKNLVEMLESVAKKYDRDVIFSTHPRTLKQIQNNSIKLSSKILIKKPFGFFDYINLQKNAFICLSDSGTISEESSILDFPALNIRQTHERPEAMEEASVILTDFNIERILQSIDFIKETYKPGVERMSHLVEDYSVDNVSDKICKIILSYTDFINRVVWKKNV